MPLKLVRRQKNIISRTYGMLSDNEIIFFQSLRDSDFTQRVELGFGHAVFGGRKISGCCQYRFPIKFLIIHINSSFIRLFSRLYHGARNATLLFLIIQDNINLSVAGIARNIAFQDNEALISKILIFEVHGLTDEISHIGVITMENVM